VRDQIHCHDVAVVFLEFFRKPRCGEVYNLGGGTARASILDAVSAARSGAARSSQDITRTHRVGVEHLYRLSRVGFQILPNECKLFENVFRRSDDMAANGVSLKHI